MKIDHSEYAVLRSLRASLMDTLTKAREEFGADSEEYALVLEQFSPIGVPSGRSLYPIVKFKDEANKTTYERLLKDYRATEYVSPDLDRILATLLVEGMIVGFTDRQMYGITSLGLSILRSGSFD